MRDRAPVAAVAFTKDGTKILSGDADGSFVVREASTRHVLSAFSPVRSDALSFASFAFSPDGKRAFVAGSRERAVRVRDTATGAELARLEQGDRVRQLLVLDDELLAVRLGDSIEVVANAESRSVVSLPVPGALGMALAPDGSLAASGKDSVFFFDARTGKETRKKLVWKKKRDAPDEEETDDEPRLGAHKAAWLAFSPDGTRLATAGGRSIRVWLLETAELDFELGAEDFVGQVVFSPDGKRIASAGEDEPLHVWSVGKEKEIGKLEGHASSVTCVAYSPDGKLLVSGSKDATVRAWEARKGGEQEEWSGHLGAIRSIAFARDGTVVTSGEDGRVIVWNAEKGALESEHEGSGAVLSRNGKIAVLVEKGIAILEGDSTRPIDIEGDIELAGFDAEGKEIVAFTRGKRPRALVINATDGDSTSHKLGGAPVLRAALAPGRRALYWIDEKKALRTCDLETGATARLGGRQAVDLAFSPDGKELFVIDDGKLLALDPTTGEEKRVLGEAEPPLAAGGDAVAAGSSIFTKAGVRRISARPTVIAVSPDGKLVATGDSAGGAWVWPVP